MIIVTGGAGFIGSAIIWRLNQLGRDDIIVIDHLGTEEKWKNLVPLKFRDYIEKDDFLDLVSNGRLSSVSGFDQSGIEAIVHMGACSSTTQQDATYLVKNN
ncbi:MAG: NAD-dependent epimerase/dehydratase family protein, partial [Thermodesulfobacteriota bacterium]|nr:NAD-dependent epimerase/dehydratase family protein [Thermodesulfobacteriota bacterium]